MYHTKPRNTLLLSAALMASMAAPALAGNSRPNTDPAPFITKAYERMVSAENAIEAKDASTARAQINEARKELTQAQQNMQDHRLYKQVAALDVGMNNLNTMLKGRDTDAFTHAQAKALEIQDILHNLAQS